MTLTYYLSMAVALLTSTHALKCWKCINAASDEECRVRGKLVDCLPNELACQNEVRTEIVESRITFKISKRCKQAHACHNNFIQNSRPAWYPTQCNPKIPHSVCRCCCNKNGCNADAFKCLSRPMLCDSLASPSNGFKECHYKDMENELGSKCRFSCNRGFRLAGEPMSDCKLKEGEITAKFDYPTPDCVEPERERCKAFQDNFSNGKVSCTNFNAIGSKCTFSCNNGYIIRGNNKIMCGPNSTWTEFPPTCVKMTCELLETKSSYEKVSCSNRNNLGSVCQFSCDRGYALNGTSSIICRNNQAKNGKGSWSNESPTCKRIVCQPFHADLVNGEVICSDANNEGSSCFFTCGPNFVLSGTSVLTCLDDGNGDFLGAWSSLPPRCLLEICEPLVKMPEHGQAFCTNSNHIGSECTFSCAAGFFVSGTTTTTCGPDKSWSNPPSNCVKITCDPIQNLPRNGTVLCDDDNNLGSICSFACNDQHEIIGNNATVCITDQDSFNNGVWSNKPPECRRIECPSQGLLSDGSISCTDGNFVSSTCIFKCNEGFMIKPINNIRNTCQANKTWSLPKPCCAKNITLYDQTQMTELEHRTTVQRRITSENNIRDGDLKT